MKNYGILLEYDGSNYYGWQKQDDYMSIQETLETILGDFFGTPIHLHGSGRTDRGVHAMGQVANFMVESTIPGERLKYALNPKLPDDIAIRASAEMPMDFHARYSARGKTYIYRLYCSKERRPLYGNRYGQCQYPLDVELMQECAKDLLGTHDFNAFKSKRTELENTIRTIYKAEIRQCGECLEFEFSGNGFMYNMVRIMTGTLIDIGRGFYEPGRIRELLELKDRTKAGHTAPACGLYLQEVRYEQKYFKNY